MFLFTRHNWTKPCPPREVRATTSNNANAKTAYGVLGDHDDGLQGALAPQRQDVVLQARVPTHENDVPLQPRGQGGRVHPQGVGDAARDAGHLNKRNGTCMMLTFEYIT